MVVPSLFTRLLACVLATTYVFADTSLFFLGADEQPLSVNELGVDSNGRTSWQVVGGAPTGTFTDVSFSNTAILIEGSSDAVIMYSFSDLGYWGSASCAFGPNNIATCNQAWGMPSSTDVSAGLETVVPFLVQGGASSSPSSVTSTSLNPSITTTGSGTRMTVSSTGITGSGANTASPPTKTASGAVHAGQNLAAGVVVGLLAYMLA